MRRGGATPGDKIAITGIPGSAAAGMKLLLRNSKTSSQATRQLVQRFLKPFPRIIEGQLLVEQGVKTAIDVSDGLLADLKHVLQASGTSALLDIDSLPVDLLTEASFTKAHALNLALTGGEDYELLFTASLKTIQVISKALKTPVTVIGEVIHKQPEPVKLIGNSLELINLKQEGWNHFA